MLTTSDWILFSFLLFASLLGMAVSSILFFLNRTESLAPRLLAAYLFSFSLFLTHFSLTFTDFFLHAPHLWRSTAFLSFACPAITYIYVRSVVSQSYSLKGRDWLFFTPGLLYCITLAPFYFKTADEKRRYIEMLLQDRRLISLEPESMLPPGWGVVARLAVGLTFVLMQLHMLTSWKRKHRESIQNLEVERWLWQFTIFHLAYYLLVLINQLSQFAAGPDLSVILSLVYMMNMLFVCSYLFLKPSILYRFTGWPDHTPPLDSAISGTEASPKVTDKRIFFSAEQGRVLRERLSDHLLNRKPYLKQGYRLKDLSEELDVPTYQLSAFINQEYGMNFNEWINGFRIQHVSEILGKSPDKHLLTLEALAKEAGFNSRTAFFIAVKKQTGKSPSDYFNVHTSS